VSHALLWIRALRVFEQTLRIVRVTPTRNHVDESHQHEITWKQSLKQQASLMVPSFQERKLARCTCSIELRANSLTG
jgi:hypothetical protein